MDVSAQILDHVQWYLNLIKVGIVKQLQYLRFYNTGETADKVRTLIESGKGYIIVPKHIATLVQGKGRRPGKMPPVQEIAKWIESRNLDLNPWAVAMSMKKKGNEVYQRKREGINIEAEVEANREEFLKRIAQELKINIIKKYKSL